MSYEYSIATLEDGVPGLETLLSLGVIWPQDEPTPYTFEAPLGDGGVRGLGWSVVQWHWNVMRVAQWNILRPYCPEKSSDVIIRTYDVHENQSWKNYQCKMIWPTARPFTAGRVLDFTIIFQALVEIPDA